MISNTPITGDMPNIPPITVPEQSILVISGSASEGDSILQTLQIRGVGERRMCTYEEATETLRSLEPVLVIFDSRDHAANVIALLPLLDTIGCGGIVLADRFDEEFFLTCHDRGIRDYLVQPVPTPYLLSRVLMFFAEQQLLTRLSEHESVLQELNIISTRSHLFTTRHIIECLRHEVNHHLSASDKPLSLLVVQTGGYPAPLPKEEQATVYGTLGQIIKSCCRSLDLAGEYFEDKFIVLLPETGTAGAQTVARRLLERLQGLTLTLTQGKIQLQARVGIAEYRNCKHYEDFLNQALRNLASGHIPA
ncbi:MAG: GGDEF domain-containing protein [Candidatus Melainabacteria bacterium]